MIKGLWQYRRPDAEKAHVALDEMDRRWSAEPRNCGDGVFLGEQEFTRGAAKTLTIVPYIAGGLLYRVAGMFNPVGGILAGVAALAVAFGGTSGMAWMTQCLGTHLAPRIPSQALVLRRSWSWIIVAFITAVIFIGILGHGVRLS